MHTHARIRGTRHKFPLDARRRRATRLIVRTYKLTPRVLMFSSLPPTLLLVPFVLPGQREFSFLPIDTPSISHAALSFPPFPSSFASPRRSHLLERHRETNRSPLLGKFAGAIRSAYKRGNKICLPFYRLHFFTPRALPPARDVRSFVRSLFPRETLSRLPYLTSPHLT